MNPGELVPGVDSIRILVQGYNQDADGEQERDNPQGTVHRDCVDEGHEDTTDSEYEVDESHDAVVSFVFHM